MNLIVVGLGFFWMIDAVLQMNLFVHCPGVLKLSNTGMSIVMTIALAGIAMGSFGAGLISKGKVQLLLTPFGGVGMATSLLLLVILQPIDVYFFSTLIFFTAMFSGVFMVPLSAFIQTMVEGRKQSDMIAYSNFITFVLLFIASGIFGIIADLYGTNAVFLFLLFAMITITTLLIILVTEMRKRVKCFLRINRN
jgi:acyl-[acyl-carrier-protein]-phospholipid O-acyltransferase/long-chain-fatty-acid--[acyl-carrier-protein] ligase